jgi:hypothetical protein
MNITDAITDLAAIIDPGLLGSHIDQINRMIPEKIDSMIPSYELNADGIAVSGLFCLTNQLLLEVGMPNGTSQLEFDVVRRDSIVNVRIKKWDHALVNEATGSITQQMAKVTLMHDGAGGAHSILTYVGADREKWIERFLSLGFIKGLLR